MCLCSCTSNQASVSEDLTYEDFAKYIFQELPLNKKELILKHSVFFIPDSVVDLCPPEWERILAAGDTSVSIGYLEVAYKAKQKIERESRRLGVMKEDVKLTLYRDIISSLEKDISSFCENEGLIDECKSMNFNRLVPYSQPNNGVDGKYYGIIVCKGSKRDYVWDFGAIHLFGNWYFIEIDLNREDDGISKLEKLEK